MDPSEPTLKQLQYLAALDEVPHFRRAAERLGVSQPTLSAQIQVLEEALGLHLVERSRSGVTLTPLGREVVAKARPVLAGAREILDFAREGRTGLAGTIRLGSLSTLGPYLLPHVVARLHRQYPSLSLYVRECQPEAQKRELSEGRHDVLLTQIPFSGQDFVNEELFHEPLYLAVARDHPLAVRGRVTMKDIRDETMLSLGMRFPLHAEVSRLAASYGARMQADYEGTSLDALRLMIGMGMGASFLPALYVFSEIRSGSDVVALPVQGQRLERRVALTWRKGAGRATAYRKLAAIIRETVRRRFKELTVTGNPDADLAIIRGGV